MLSFICWQRASKWSTAVMPSTKENYNRWRLHRSCEKKTLLQVFDVLKVLKHYLSHLFSLSFSDFLNIQKMCFAYIICMFLLICLFIYKLDASSSQSRHLEGVRDVPRHSANLPMLHHIFRIMHLWKFLTLFSLKCAHSSTSKWNVSLLVEVFPYEMHKNQWVGGM